MTGRRVSSITVLLALGAGAALALVPTNPVLVPGPTGGNESHKVGDYFAVPPHDSLLVVQSGVDRGDAFSGPTDYPPQRHIAYIPSEDTYMAAYEWNAANDFMVSARYWQEVAGFGFWSAEGTPSERGLQSDAGRPSLHAREGGLAIAYHGVAGASDFQVYFNDFDFATQSWGTSLLLADDLPSTNFPFLDRSSDGTWMVACDNGAIGNPYNDVIVLLSNDGLTWTRSTVQTNAAMNWTLPTGAADPSNGDLYVAYHDDFDDDLDADVVIHRSSDGGVTWSAQQLVATGDPFGQAIVPSIVVGSDHEVHVIYQRNITGDFVAGEGLMGFNEIGIAGAPWYVSGSFDGGDTWSGGTPEPMLPREGLVAEPDSCDLHPTLATVATDTCTGMPQLGIYRGAARDVLYAAYNQPYVAERQAEGTMICGPFQVWMQSMEVGDGFPGEWSERWMVSEIDWEQYAEGRSSIYVGITHEIPVAGPGLVWSEMNESAAPASVLFKRPIAAPGIEDQRPGAPAPRGTARLHPATPNPFNPMTRIDYELSEASVVSLEVYDAAGRVVRTLERGTRPAGRHSVTWKGTNDSGVAVSSGVYFYRLGTEDSSETRSMLLVK